MRTLLIAAALILAIATDAAACLQTYGTDLHSHRKDFEGLTGDALVELLLAHQSHREWEQTAARLAERLKTNPTIEDRNDYAVALVHLGRVLEALGMLRKIEAEQPGRYETAANLGTALELSGDDRGALRWIREGLRRNMKEHYGTEWLHVRILEAKLARARDPKWLERHSVAGTDFGSAAKPVLPRQLPAGNDGLPVTAKELSEAFNYQLSERLQFVAAPEPIVADLLFDWGSLLALTEVVESADAVYTLAEKYQPVRRELFEKRRALMKGTLKRATWRRESR